MTKSALYNKHFAKLVESIESLSVIDKQIFFSDYKTDGLIEAFNLMSICEDPKDNSQIDIAIISADKFQVRFGPGLKAVEKSGLEKAETLIKLWFKVAAPDREAELEALLAPPAPAPVVEPAPAPIAVAPAPAPVPKRKKLWGIF